MVQILLNGNGISDILIRFINDWYKYFKRLALVVILMALVVAGIQIMLRNADSKVKAYESFKVIILAVALI